MDTGFGIIKAIPNKVPTVVSVLNLKGGVGKTTVAALLARFASGTGGYNMTWQKSLDVLAVDLDPQANLSQALMGEKPYKAFMENKEPAIVELFNGFAPASLSSSSPTPIGSSHVVKPVSLPFNPASSVAGTLEIIPSRFDFSDKLINATRSDEKILANFISREMQHKDLILIDCAPTESILTRTAYHASRYVLIPVRTEFFATIGFPLMQESLENFRRNNRAHNIDVCGVLINRNRTSGSGLGPHHRTALKEILEHAKIYRWPVLKNRMDHSDGYPKWAKDPHATHLGNAPNEWPKIAQKILQCVGL